MTQKTDVLTGIVELLEPLSSEERMRNVSAALIFLGETSLPSAPAAKGLTGAAMPDDKTGETGASNARTQAWMKQNNITSDDLEQVFHITAEGIEVIMQSMPGKSNTDQGHNAYILTGIAQLVFTGIPSFTDQAARTLCENSGCYDVSNHSKVIKSKGNEFTGSKDKGWTLTAPGLKRGAELVKEINKAAE